jgi:hypothetical protein
MYVTVTRKMLAYSPNILQSRDADWRATGGELNAPLLPLTKASP